MDSRKQTAEIIKIEQEIERVKKAIIETESRYLKNDYQKYLKKLYRKLKSEIYRKGD